MKPHSVSSRKSNTSLLEGELFEAPVRGGNETSKDPVAMTSNNSISGAKLLKNVEKSYDKGKNFLNNLKIRKLCKAEIANHLLLSVTRNMWMLL